MEDDEFFESERRYRLKIMLGVLANTSCGEFVISRNKLAESYLALYHRIDPYVDIYSAEFLDLVLDVMVSSGMRELEDEK